MKKLSLLLAFLIALASCNSGQKQQTASETETSQENTEGEREPTDEEIREYGILTAIEDSGYPLFAIDVEFPERNTTASFSFNVENSPLSVEQLTAMEGKYATIYYVVEDDPFVESIVRECEPVWGEIASQSDGIKEITGILSGASSVSGDLPGTITITEENGSKMEFELFIKDEVVAVNNEEVTVFYYESSSQTITYLKQSED